MSKSDKNNSKKITKSKKYIEDSDEDDDEQQQSIAKIQQKSKKDKINFDEDDDHEEEGDDLMDDDDEDSEEEEDEAATQEEFNDFIDDNVDAGNEDDEEENSKKSDKKKKKKKKDKNDDDESGGSSSSSASSSSEELQSDLEEDDLDLIKDNLNVDDLEQVGIKKDKKRRRIQVHSESSEDDEEVKAVSKPKQKRPIESKQKNSQENEADSEENEGQDAEEEKEEELSNLDAPGRDREHRQNDYESDEESFIFDDSDDENKAKGSNKDKNIRKKRVYNDEAQQEALDIFGVDAEELGVIDEDDDDHMEGDEDEEDEYYSEDDEEGAGGENDDDEEGGMSYSRAAKKRQTKRRMKALHKIEDIFEPLELEKNLMTEYDQQIRIEDKPERFMMRTVPVTAEPDENELEREADWIYNHAFLTNSFVSNRELFTLKDARCIPKIKDVLNFIRNEFFEVPFIATYRKEYIQPDLSIEDLWKIYDWDEKYCQLKNRKDNLTKLFERMKTYQQDQINELNQKKDELRTSLSGQLEDDDEAIEEQLNAINALLDTIRVLKDNDIYRVKSIQTSEEYLDCYQHFQLYYGPDIAPMKEYELRNKKAVREAKKRQKQIEEGEEEENEEYEEDDGDLDEEELNKLSTKYAQRKDRYHYCKMAGLNVFSQRFGLTAEQFSENMHADFQKHELDQYSVDPKSLANDYVKPPYFDSVEQVLSTVRYMISVEFAREPSIRAFVRDFYYDNATISVRATMTRGFNEIDENHPCYKFKYLKNKPCKDLIGDDYLKLALAEQDGLLTIKFDVASNSLQSSVQDDPLPPPPAPKASDDDWDEPRTNTTAASSSKKSTRTTSSSSSFACLAEKLKSFYYKDEFSYNVEQWNIQRGLIVNEMLNKFLFPEFEKELRAKLLKEAKLYVCSECAKKLRSILKTAPYSISGGTTSLDDEDGLRVLSIAYSSHQSDNGGGDHPNMAICACVNGDGEMDDFLGMKNLQVRLNINNQRENEFMSDEKRDKISEMKRLEEYILDKRPKLIIISAENKDALNIMDDLNDLIKKMQLDHNMHSINIELIDNEVAKLIDSSHHCQQYFAQSSSNHSLIKQAVTLARFVQDPLLCCSQLFNNDRDILGMKLHAIQNLLISTSGGRNSIDASDLLHHLEIEFVNIANEVGVDLNRCNQTPHTSNVLQFVSGLGLRKSQYLLKILRQERLALKSTLPFDKQLKTYPVIVNRLSLVTKCQLGRRVFINSAGFIKFDVDFISKEIDEDEDSSDKSDDAMCTEPLDSTRIHPETYEWARKMAIDALDFDDTTENPNPISALKEILENPKRLKDLDLDAFAEELLRTGHGNKIVTLYDIRQELNYRFRDKRVAFQSMSNEEKFYCLLNETPFSFHVGKLILCKVTGIVRRRPNKEQLDEANPIKDDNTCTWQCSFCKRNDFTELSKVWTHFDTGECPGPAIGIRTMLDNGCQGFLSLKMLSDNPVNNPDDRIKVGMVIHARVREIQVDKFRIDLTSRTSDLKDLNDQFKPQKDRFYDFGSEEEDRNKLIDKKKKEEHKQTYTKRVISHPQFKNYAYAQAVNMLKDQSFGDCIIRPSSKGADHLTATWKVYDDCFQHVDILEEKKANVFSIGKRLIIDGEDYEDLDEILARYINPMANFVKEIISHKNFKPLNQIDASLNEKTQFTNSKPSELCLQSCEKLLAQERLKNPSRIPYMFIVCLNFPGRFLLLYTVKSKPRYEFIKVTSEGFVFREKRFNNFNELLSWFKVHFNDYVPPPPPPSKPQESIQPPPIETNNDYSDSFTSMNISDPPRNDSYNERGGSRPYNNDNNRPFNQNGSNYNRNNNTNNNSNNRSFGRGGGDDRRNRGFNNSGRGGFDRNRGGFRNNNNKSFGSSGVGGGGGSQRPYETPQQPMQRADNYENWDGDALKSGSQFNSSNTFNKPQSQTYTSNKNDEENWDDDAPKSSTNNNRPAAPPPTAPKSKPYQAKVNDENWEDDVPPSSNNYRPTQLPPPTAQLPRANSFNRNNNNNKPSNNHNEENWDEQPARPAAAQERLKNPSQFNKTSYQPPAPSAQQKAAASDNEMWDDGVPAVNTSNKFNKAPLISNSNSFNKNNYSNSNKPSAAANDEDMWD